MPDTDYSNVTSVTLTNNGTETVTIQMYRANLFKDIEVGSTLTLKITESEEAVYYKDLETDTLAVEVTSGGGGGSSSLADLTDVDLSSPEDGQMLKYDANSGKWVNSNGFVVPPVTIIQCGDGYDPEITLPSGFDEEKLSSITIFDNIIVRRTLSNGDSDGDYGFVGYSGEGKPVFVSAGGNGTKIQWIMIDVPFDGYGEVYKANSDS